MNNLVYNPYPAELVQILQVCSTMAGLFVLVILALLWFKG